jgi:hypothetical protein
MCNTAESETGFKMEASLMGEVMGDEEDNSLADNIGRDLEWECRLLLQLRLLLLLRLR